MPIRSSYAQTIGQDRLPGRGQSMKLAGVTGRALSTKKGSISINSPSPNGEGYGAYLNTLSAICTSKPLVKIPVVAYLNNISLVSSMRVSPE